MHECTLKLRHTSRTEGWQTVLDVQDLRSRDKGHYSAPGRCRTEAHVLRPLEVVTRSATQPSDRPSSREALG
jgi:hypothetical protein